MKNQIKPIQDIKLALDKQAYFGDRSAQRLLKKHGLHATQSTAVPTKPRAGLDAIPESDLRAWLDAFLVQAEQREQDAAQNRADPGYSN